MSSFGLNLNSGGDFLAIVKIDARSGRIFRVDRNEDGEATPTDITDVFEGVFDLAHAEAGWALFVAGAAPDFAMAPIGEPLPPQPSQNHRQGVRLRLLLAPKAAGKMERLREVAVTSKAVIRALEALYDQWLAGRDKNAGKTVLTRLGGVKPVVSVGGGQKSTNYEPVFTVARWVPVPKEFEGPPARAAAVPNGAGAADAYRAAKDGPKPSAASAGPPAPPPPVPPADADDWG